MKCKIASSHAVKENAMITDYVHNFIVMQCGKTLHTKNINKIPILVAEHRQEKHRKQKHKKKGGE